MMKTEVEINPDVYKEQDYMKNIKLMAFDMDGVLLKNRNSWDVIMNSVYGIEKNDDKMVYTFEYLYENNIHESIYAYISESLIKKCFKLNNLSENVYRTMQVLKSRGIKTAIVSAGSSVFANYLKDIFDFDYAVGNEIDYRNKIFVKKVDPLKKDINIRDIQKKFGYTMENTISVGDSIMDLSMKKESKYFVAFNPSNKEMLKSSDFVVNSQNLYDIIRILNINSGV